MSIAPTVEFTRKIAGELVNRAERQVGKRMDAYEVVARSIGTSSSWLRKFISGQAKEPGWTTGWSILDQYSRICDRVEAAIETERARTLALKESVNAAASIANRVVESASSKSTS